MPRLLRETFFSLRDLALASGPFVLLAAALAAAAYFLLDPAPPRGVVLATGPELSAYARFGERYAAELARYGIRVELRQTAGSRENLRLLRDPAARVDLAFVQGGAGDSAGAQEEQKKSGIELLSLGTISYEPLWIFYREEAARQVDRQATLSALTQLRGWRVNVGGRGSGGPGLMTRLLRANLMERDDIRRSNLEETAAVQALLEGGLDAAVLVSPPESPMVQMLLATPGVRLYEFAQAEAYARRYAYLAPVTLPKGVADVARDVPPRDLNLVATTTSLVAREDIHPALVQLFVQAAARIHGGPGWIARAGYFPNAQSGEFPLAKDAARYYQSGPPLLQRYLPFWLANLVDRMWVALFSIVAVLIPLSRLVPPLYAWRVRSRIFRWYRNLREIELEVERGEKGAEALLEGLDKLDAKAANIVVPLLYADQVYALRMHIELVRARLRNQT